MTNADDPTDEDLGATIEAGITQGGEAEKPDTPLVCPFCKSEMVLPRKGTEPYYCAACRRTFLPTTSGQVSKAVTPECPHCDGGNRFTEPIPGSQIWYCACCSREFIPASSPPSA